MPLVRTECNPTTPLPATLDAPVCSSSEVRQVYLRIADGSSSNLVDGASDFWGSVSLMAYSSKSIFLNTDVFLSDALFASAL